MNPKLRVMFCAIIWVIACVPVATTIYMDKVWGYVLPWDDRLVLFFLQLILWAGAALFTRKQMRIREEQIYEQRAEIFRRHFEIDPPQIDGRGYSWKDILMMQPVVDKTLKRMAEAISEAFSREREFLQMRRESADELNDALEEKDLLNYCSKNALQEFTEAHGIAKLFRFSVKEDYCKYLLTEPEKPRRPIRARV